MREVFLDIGELGWSLYLSAHMRWLKENNYPIPAIMTSPGRKALYNDMKPTFFKVPDEFYNDFSGRPQNCFALYVASGKELRDYFNSRLPVDYAISESQPFDCHLYKKIYVRKMIFTSYPYEAKLRGQKEILVFPRARMAVPFDLRNLTRAFYIALINRLCEEFKNFTIRTLGTKTGAYDLTEIQKSNFINFVGKTPTVQTLIDRYQLAIVTIGGQSAPPTLGLLQGIPTFMIGHEKDRHVRHENWMNTKAGFYEINKNNYDQFEFTDCITQIVDFVEECK